MAVRSPERACARASACEQTQPYRSSPGGSGARNVRWACWRLRHHCASSLTRPFGTLRQREWDGARPTATLVTRQEVGAWEGGRASCHARRRGSRPRALVTSRTIGYSIGAVVSVPLGGHQAEGGTRFRRSADRGRTTCVIPQSKAHRHDSRRSPLERGPAAPRRPCHRHGCGVGRGYPGWGRCRRVG
jgi:hypothetical protein